MSGIDRLDLRGLGFALSGLVQFWMLPLFMFVASCALMLLIGGPMIRWLRNKSWRKDAATWTVREDTPDTHQAKQGTPSMGGIGIIGAAVATFISLGFIYIAVIFASWGSILASRIANNGWTHLIVSLALLPVLVVAHALLGFADDWSKATGRGGLRARAKLFVQIALAGLFVGVLFVLTLSQQFTGVRFLFEGLAAVSNDIPLLIGTLVFLAFVVIATCNAVNLTDGIDGLAAGLTVQAGLALILMVPNFYEVKFSNDLFWAALSGACLGFLWFNKYPARVFMGDTGSLAIGAALGVAGVLSRAVFLLPFIGFIFYIEMFSVIAQVLWFKWTKRQGGEGKRLFRRAPLHHHFELSGWSEWRVVATFWLINALMASLGLLLWHWEVIPRWP